MDFIVILLGVSLVLLVLLVIYIVVGESRLAARLASLEEEVRVLKSRAGSAPPSITSQLPPVIPTPESHPPPLPVMPAGAQSINWEQFMGAKLFAWIGGVAFFLGIAFFLKYSFEHNLIPPAMRAVIGFAVGISLVGLGMLLKRKESAVTSQTLCGTGVLVLYAVTFACRSYYHFAFFELLPTLALMTLITAMAFVLSVRLDALVVAVLGIAGGFLTPLVLFTGQDNPAALFSYIALLDVGLLAVAQRQRWASLPVLGALGTILTQGMWVGDFFVQERYFEGEKVLGAMAIFGGLEALFLLAAAWNRRAGGRSREFSAAPLCLSLSAMASACYFAGLSPLGMRVSLLFGYALLLELGFFALAFIHGGLASTRAGLFSALALESTWYFHQFKPQAWALPFEWFLVFYAVFTLFPFLFHRRFAVTAGPWIAAALAGPFHFFLLYRMLRLAHPEFPPGLVPAAFAIPSLCGLWFLVKHTPAESPARQTQLALFGGAALFFLTAIFAVQFDREWITIGWALEGAALCWLCHRVPHSGLRLVGAGLLVAAFTRLALNDAVFSYHPRAGVAFFNWYLYAYGIVTVCLFAGGRLLAPPRNRVLDIDAPPWLYTLGTVLAFFLLNIEIADYFTPPGAPTLKFQFSGDFARDMTYSIAWALFALMVLITGIRKNATVVRYGGLGLLGCTLLKLFVHDLSQLDQLYRIGALLGVAVVAIVASFLYQRFVGSTEPSRPPAA